jgi:chromosome segregation ATPase
MDYKALSLTILEELSNPHVDKTYVSAKVRACIDESSTDLYKIMDTKNKELQKELVEANEKITEITDEMEQIQDSAEKAAQMKFVHIIQQFEKERSEMAAQLARAQTTFNQMNEYIQKLHAENANLKAFHA